MTFGIAFDIIKVNTFANRTEIVSVDNIKAKRGMRLPNWQSDVVIRIQVPDEHSKMTAPYLYIESRFGKVPWKETMIELFSNKWELVN